MSIHRHGLQLQTGPLFQAYKASQKIGNDVNEAQNGYNFTSALNVPPRKLSYGPGYL
jgi:hypothetical protein